MALITEYMPNNRIIWRKIPVMTTSEIKGERPFSEHETRLCSVAQSVSYPELSKQMCDHPNSTR